MNRALVTLAFWSVVMSVLVGVLAWMGALALESGPAEFGGFAACATFGWQAWTWLKVWKDQP